MTGRGTTSYTIRLWFFAILCAGSFFIINPGALFAAGESGADPAVSFKGYLSTRYVYRWTEVANEKITDQDVFGELRIDMTTPKTNTYEFHFFGTARDDLSGNHNTTTFYPYEDIGDTYQSNSHGYLYEAHLDVNNMLPYVTQVRLGRQAGTRDEPVFFDGLAADIGGSKLNLTLYGGEAVHFYEVNYKWGDDTLGGVGLDYAPWRSTKLSLDYLSVNDLHQFPSDRDQKDQLYAFKIWQRLGDSTKATAKLRYVNGDPRDVSVRALSAFPNAGTELNVNYQRQFRTQNELSTELSSFFDVLGQSFPYQSYDVKVRQLFGEHYAFDLGYFKRTLLDASQENFFNHDYSRSFVLLELIDLPARGVSLTLTGERWETQNREYNSAGFDLGYAFNKPRNASINVGTYYSLYKYDYYIELGNRDNVRTYYLNGRFPLGKSLSINGSYEYEKSLENYQTLKLGMRYDF